MINIAIIEDDKEQAAQLEAALRQYSDEYKTPLQISVFYNAVVFLEKYTAKYDIIYMDIMMPMLNGMDASRMLREKDDQVMLIFVTSMQQFAIQGYEVGASDFIVKPVNYPEFKLKFTRVLERLPKKENEDILVKTETGFVRLSPAQITYVEVQDHDLIYHTVGGVLESKGTLAEAEERLDPKQFFRCGKSHLVNLEFVEGVENSDVQVGDDVVQVSRARRKALLDALNDYINEVSK